MSDKKPLRFGHDETPIDEAADRINDGALPDFYDPSSIPGHAEQVLANEIASSTVMSEKAKQSYYERFGAEPGDLPADFVFARVRGPDGKRSYNADVALMEYKRRGYRPATTEDLSRLGYGMPVACEVGPDGVIYREDTALFIVDGEQAKKLEKRKRDAAHMAEGAAGEHDRADETWVAEEAREMRPATIRPFGG